MYIDTKVIEKDIEKMEKIRSNIIGGVGRTENMVSKLDGCFPGVTGVAEYFRRNSSKLPTVKDFYQELEHVSSKVIQQWKDYLFKAIDLDRRLAQETNPSIYFGGTPTQINPERNPQMIAASVKGVPAVISPTDYIPSYTSITYTYTPVQVPSIIEPINPYLQWDRYPNWRNETISNPWEFNMSPVPDYDDLFNRTSSNPIPQTYLSDYYPFIDEPIAPFDPSNPEVITNPYDPNYPNDPYDPNNPYDPNYPYDPNNPYGPNSYDPNNPYGPNSYDPYNPYNPNYPYDPNNPYGPGYQYTPTDPYNPNYPYNPDNPYGPRLFDPNNPYGPGYTYTQTDPYNPNNPNGPNSFDPNNPYGPDNPYNPYEPNYPSNPNNPGNPYVSPFDNPDTDPNGPRGPWDYIQPSWPDLPPAQPTVISLGLLTAPQPNSYPSVQPRDPLVDPTKINSNDPSKPNLPGIEIDPNDIIDAMKDKIKGGTSNRETNNGSGSASGSIGKKGLSANISDAIKRSSNLLTGGIIPTKGNSSSNNALLGGLVTGGLGLGAAGITGGVIANNKLKYIVFKPQDFERQDEETQNAIINDLVEAGLSNNEVLLFQNSTFKIESNEMNPHIKKAEKAYDNNADFANEIKEMYGFSIFDKSDKLDKYLLFAAMIIDGSNTTDETNIYNLINPSLEDEEVDFIYSGIDMNEYIVTEEDEENVEKDDSEENASKEKNEKISTALDWLNEIGIDDYN